MTTKPKTTRKKPDDGLDLANDDAPKTRGKGDNSKRFDAELINEALEDIEGIEARMKKRLEEAQKKNQPDREKIKQIRADIVESGVPAKELATLIRKRRLERNLDNIDASLDDEQKETFANLVQALGEFKDSPLGQAALKRAETRK